MPNFHPDTKSDSSATFIAKVGALYLVVLVIMFNVASVLAPWVESGNHGDGFTRVEYILSTMACYGGACTSVARGYGDPHFMLYQCTAAAFWLGCCFGMLYSEWGSATPACDREGGLLGSQFGMARGLPNLAHA